MELNQYPLRIEITNRCNLRCEYCLSLASSDYRNRPETDFDALIKFIKYLQINQLFLLGGEVCYYYKIDELANYCLENKVGLKIATNGTLLDRYKEISKINKNITYVVSYNKEGCRDRLKMCDKFVKEMNVKVINILLNEENKDTINDTVEKFQKTKKVNWMCIFSDERTKKGRYDSLFESLVSRYDKVFIFDYLLKKGAIERIEDYKAHKHNIRCCHPLSLKGNNISFCKNIEDFGMKITGIDFSKKKNVDGLKIEFNKFQKKINLGKVPGCGECRFKELLTEVDDALEWVSSNANLRNIPINCTSLCWSLLKNKAFYSLR